VPLWVRDVEDGDGVLLLLSGAEIYGGREGGLARLASFVLKVRVYSRCTHGRIDVLVREAYDTRKIVQRRERYILPARRAFRSIHY
jgi:hypothetical protein